MTGKGLGAESSCFTKIVTSRFSAYPNDSFYFLFQLPYQPLGATLCGFACIPLSFILAQIPAVELTWTV